MPKFKVELEIAIEDLVCPHCGEQHQDIDEWALKPHKTHLCLHCGELFDGSMYAVSNPVIQPKFRGKFASFDEQANGFQTKVFSDEEVRELAINIVDTQSKMNPELSPQFRDFLEEIQRRDAEDNLNIQRRGGRND